MNKLIAASVAAVLLPMAACADTPPTPPTPPAAPEIDASMEACGDNCTKHVVRTVTVEIDDDGNETRSETVRVIRHSGELTEEQKTEIEAMISDGDHDGHMMMFKSGGEHEMMSGDGHVVIMMKTIGEDGEEITVNSLGDTDIENTVSEDGTRTIRITSGDSGEATVITITKESSE